MSVLIEMPPLIGCAGELREICPNRTVYLPFGISGKGCRCVRNGWCRELGRRCGVIGVEANISKTREEQIAHHDNQNDPQNSKSGSTKTDNPAHASPLQME